MGVVSQRVDMHNSLWGEHLDENGEELPRTGRSTCTVVAYEGRHTRIRARIHGIDTRHRRTRSNTGNVAQ